MKKIFYISAFAALLAGASLTSCSDFLEAKDKSSGGKTDADFFPSNPTTLLTSAYVNLRAYSDVTSNTNIFDKGTDLYADQSRAQGKIELDLYSMSADCESTKSFYVNAMSCINNANGAIKYAGSDSEIGSQARFLRAYSYYMLTQQFGAVPYSTDYIQSSSRNYARTDLAEIYSKITEDLQALYDNSPLADVDNVSGKPSKKACAALLAKVYLAWGWDIDVTVASQSDLEKGVFTVNSTANFDKAAEWAQKALSGINFASQTFEKKWDPKNQTNSEFIFAVKYLAAGVSDITKYSNSQSGSYGGYYSPLVGCDSRNQQSEKSVLLFEKGDQRYDATFMTTFYNDYYAYWNEADAANTIALDKTGKFFPWYVTDAEISAWCTAHASQLASNTSIVRIGSEDGTEVQNYTPAGAKKGSAEAYTAYNGKTNAGVKVKKFDDPENKANCYHDIILLDASDIQLTLAEAYLMAGNDAKFFEAINVLRSRAFADSYVALNAISDYTYSYSTSAGFANVSDQMKKLDLLLDERGRETYAQKLRWADLRRTKQLIRYNVEFNREITSASNMKGTDGLLKFYRPIPQAEIENNDAITPADQNDGYKAAATEASVSGDTSSDASNG